MKRLIALIIVLLVGFYVAWPGWTAYQISTALKAKDAGVLERKIDFGRVRESLKPAATTKIGEVYDTYQAKAGAGAAIVGQIKKDVVPKIADTALKSLVTAPNLIKVASEGGTLKSNVEKLLKEQIAKIGLPGIGGLNLPGGLGNVLGGGGGSPGGAGLGGLPGGLGNLAGKLPGGLGGKIPGFGGAPAAAQPAPAPAPAAKPEPPSKPPS